MTGNPLDNVLRHLYEITARAEFKAESDQKLLERYVERRDELAFEELVRRYRMMIWFVCWRVLRHHQDVEDAFQATIMTLVRRAKTILGRETIEGWLHNTAYKVASNAKVARTRRHTLEEQGAKMRTENFEGNDFRRELSEVLDKELTQIPEKFRNPLILCYLEGLTREQAAQRLGISLRNLDARLAQGRDQLQKRVSKYGMDMGHAMLIADLTSCPNHHPLPPSLVEKTLDMVRILISHHGTLETAGVSPQVAMLVNGAVGAWTLKAKIMLGLVVVMLAGTGVGIVTSSGILWRLLRIEPTHEEMLKPDQPASGDAKTREMMPRIDCYGDLLPPGALARGGTIRLRHTGNWRQGGAESVLFTPDGTALFTAGRGNPIRLWDVASGQLIHQFGERDPPGQVRAAASFNQIVLSPDGTLLASSPSGCSLFLWDVATGKLLRQWGEERIAALSFAADGKTLTAVCAGNVIRVWDVATGLGWQRRTLAGEFSDEDVWFAFAPGGKYLVSVWASKHVQLWDLDTGKAIYQLRIGKSELASPTFVAFSPDGQFLATASAAIDQDIEKDVAELCDGSVHLWDMATGKEIRCFGSDKAGTWSVAFSPDSKILATGSGAGAIRLWDVARGKEIRSCLDYRSHVVSLAFSADGRRLASGASMTDHTARVWDVGTGKEIVPRWGGHICGVQSIAFTLDGQTLISGGRDGRVGLWDAATGQERRAPLRAGDLHTFAALMPGDKTLASIGSVFAPEGKPFSVQAVQSPTSICLWDMTTGRKLHEFPGPKIKAESMVLSPDGRSLVTLNYSGSYLTATLWDVATGKGFTLANGPNSAMPLCAAFSPNSKVLALGSWGGFLTFWDIATKKRLIQYRAHRSWLRSLAFAPDGFTLATAGSDTLHQGDGKTDLGLLNSSSIRLWRCSSTNPGSVEEINILPMTRHIGLINYLTFSPDGKTLASAGQDGTVRVWETSTGVERRCFRGHQGEVCCLAFAPDGRRLASGSNDTTFLIWDVTGRLDHGRLRPARLAVEQLESWWADLAGADGTRTAEAIWILAAAESSTLAFFQSHLRAESQHVDKEIVTPLTSELDDAAVAIRQKERKNLQELDESPEQNEANSAEKRFGHKQLLKEADEKRLAPSAELLRELRAIEVLEQINTRAARQLLEILSSGDLKSRKTQEAQATLQRLNSK